MSQKPYHNEAALRRLHIDKEMNATEISEIYGVSRKTIITALRRADGFEYRKGTPRRSAEEVLA